MTPVNLLSLGCIKIGPLAGAAMSQRKEWRALSKKIQEQYFYAPSLETQAVLADLNARGFKQVLAQD